MVPEKGYLIKRVNLSADGDTTIIGKRFMCGENAEPFSSEKSAESALRRQMKQDEEYCPDCLLTYGIIKI